MEVRQTRHAEIKLIKIDTPYANIRYTGWSSSMRAADGDLVWQILREYKNGDVVESTYAEMGSFKCSWTDRSTYFSSATPDASNPLGGVQDVSGSFSLTGPSTGGLISEVTVNDTTWTRVPTTDLASRKAVSFQNYSGQTMKLNYNNATVGFVGVYLPTNSERQYDQDDIAIYAKCTSGTATLTVEEIA